MVSCRSCIPSYGPIRNFCSSILLTIAAAGTNVAFIFYEVPEDLTPSPYSAVTTLTAEVILYLTVAFSGVAALLNFVLMCGVEHEDINRQIDDEEYQERQKDRDCLDSFLDPQFRTNSDQTRAREKYFESLSHRDRIYVGGLLGPSVALTLVLLVRLFVGAPVYLGDPAALDFGWKYGIDSDVEAEKNWISAPVAEKNISFDPGFSSYGHLAQGLLTAFLATPVVMRWLMNVTRHKVNWLWKLAPFLATVYPSYNLIKRFLYSYGEAFAGTSFANNNMEWSCGFVVGLALGQFVTALSASLFMICFRREAGSSVDEEGETRNEDTDAEDEEDEDDDPLYDTSYAVTFIQYIFVIALMGTLYTAGIFYGLTWHECLDETSCVNAESAPDEETSLSVTVLSINVAVTTVLLLIGFFVWDTY